LQDIHPFIVEKYRKERREAKIEPATINRDTATLTNMFKKAVEWKYLQSNPLPTVKKLTEKDGKMWVLTPEEEQRLLEECDKRPQIKKYLRDLVLLALNTGMREAEIFNLQKCNVDLNNTHSILVTDTKNNENRRVPINETAREILKRRLKDDASDYVFYQSRSEKDGNEKPAKLKVLTNAFWDAKPDLNEKKLLKTKRKRYGSGSMIAGIHSVHG
jgi:integrase